VKPTARTILDPAVQARLGRVLTFEVLDALRQDLPAAWRPKAQAFGRGVAEAMYWHLEKALPEETAEREFKRRLERLAKMAPAFATAVEVLGDGLTQAMSRQRIFIARRQQPPTPIDVAMRQAAARSRQLRAAAEAAREAAAVAGDLLAKATRPRRWPRTAADKFIVSLAMLYDQTFPARPSASRGTVFYRLLETAIQATNDAGSSIAMPDEERLAALLARCQFRNQTRAPRGRNAHTA
jgi:hypothetical protein